jgi:predicted dithiol-disulfide oxidoreductase (DUF899 family)
VTVGWASHAARHIADVNSPDKEDILFIGYPDDVADDVASEYWNNFIARVNMANTEIVEIEEKIFELTVKLNELRKSSSDGKVRNYAFATMDGETSLLDMFGDKKQLLLIHNMGQGCRYCTLWADGFNGFLKHLESVMSVVLVSKDPPELQRRFVNSRDWRFRLASHGGGEYIVEQTVMDGSGRY